jgi:hypothetical protein
LSGAISGDGILINAAGNNAISGANTSGGLSVTGGSLSIASANSLAPANNTVSSGGTMILPSNLVFSGAITIAGNGAAGQTGALVLAAPTGGYATSSFTTLLSDDAKIALNGDGQHYHAGAINATVAGKTLTIDTGAGMFYPDGGIGANVAFLTYTYATYCALAKAPVLNQLMDSLLDRNPLTELWDCGSRSLFKMEVEELNALIEKGFPNKKALIEVLRVTK